MPVPAASGKYRLILASASPQRRKILQDAGYSFEAVDPGQAELAIANAPSPDALAIAKARAKALQVAAELQPPYPALVIGVDTLGALGDEIIGKPLDRCDGLSILMRLAGTRHRVISGLCLWPVMAPPAESLCPGQNLPAPVLAAASTWVQMRPASEEELEAYVASGEGDDKAGAYAVQEQGDQFIESLEGSFLNVVGFPLELFRELLPQMERRLG